MLKKTLAWSTPVTFSVNQVLSIQQLRVFSKTLKVHLLTAKEKSVRWTT